HPAPAHPERWHGSDCVQTRPIRLHCASFLPCCHQNSSEYSAFFLRLIAVRRSDDWLPYRSGPPIHRSATVAELSPPLNHGGRPACPPDWPYRDRYVRHATGGHVHRVAGNTGSWLRSAYGLVRLYGRSPWPQTRTAGYAPVAYRHHPRNL